MAVSREENRYSKSDLPVNQDSKSKFLHIQPKFPIKLRSNEPRSSNPRRAPSHSGVNHFLTVKAAGSLKGAGEMGRTSPPR